MMITTILGPNAYARDNALYKIITEHISTHGKDSVMRIDADEAEWSDIENALTSTSLFATGNQLITIRSASTNAHIREKLEKTLSELDATTSVVLLEPAIDKRTVFYKAVKKLGETIECKELRDYELVQWAAQEMKNNNIQFEREVPQQLIDRVGLDQRLIASEIEKLQLVDGRLTSSTLQSVTPQTPQDSIFQLLDAAMSGDIKMTMSVFEELRAAKVEPVYIVTMIGWQLYSVVLCKAAGDRSESEVAKAAGISPYVVAKAKRIAQRLSMSQLRSMTRVTADVDVHLKTKPVDGGQLVRQLLLRLVTI